MSYVPYQIDYKVSGTGKTLGVTKKKVTWKFGFANSDALRDGCTGSQCRGSEHEVIFIWSLTSGKRQIAVDGKESHFSESGMNGWTADRTFQHHFNLYSPNYGTIRCHLVTLPPDHNAPGGNRPFQLKVNGVNYFDFNSIFQLGTPSMIVRPAPAGVSGRANSEADPYMSPEERQAIAKAKLESLRDIRRATSKDSADNSTGRLAPAVGSQEQSLISFDDPPPAQTFGVGTNHTVSSMTMDFRSTSFDGANYQAAAAAAPPAANPYSNYALPPAAAPQYGQQPPAPQYAQQPAVPQYAQQPAIPQYAQQPAAPQYAQQYANPPPATQYAQPGAITAYGQPPAAEPAPYSNYGFAPQPPAPQDNYGFASPQVATAPPQNYGFAAPPAPPAPPAWGSPPPPTSYYGQHQPPAVNTTAATPTTPGGYGPGTTPQSQVSYGSAPSFAQPPRQQQPGQYGGY